MRSFAIISDSRPVSVIAVFTTALITVLFIACSGGEDPEPIPTPAPTSPPARATPILEPTPAPTAAPPTAIPEPTPEPTSAPVTEAAAPESDSGVAVSVSEGSVARYSVTEQLARLSSPIDAVGETGDVEGAIVFDADGNIVPDRSMLTVALAGLTSDESRRDRYVRDRTLNTTNYPTAEFVATGVAGLDWPFPNSGETTFQLMGDMTIMDVSSPVTWDVEAQSLEDVVTAQARTVITFDQFELSKPSLAFIVSVEDEIRLELDIEAAIERAVP